MGQKWVSMGTHCSSTGSGVRSSEESTGGERRKGGVGGGWILLQRIEADVISRDNLQRRIEGRLSGVQNVTNVKQTRGKTFKYLCFKLRSQQIARQP